MLNPVIKVSMSNMEYIPKPVDLSKVDLTDDFYNLADIIAKNVHEVWSSNRIKQGWVYGPQRNDELKQHPCLVPYEMLSEEEKQYDRDTALETLKLITTFGYKIVKK